jgi:hypothetical protein
MEGSQPAQTEVDAPIWWRSARFWTGTVNPTSAPRPRASGGLQAAGRSPWSADPASADTLLDLYGEDIRARAYTTDDPTGAR